MDSGKDTVDWNRVDRLEAPITVTLVNSLTGMTRKVTAATLSVSWLKEWDQGYRFARHLAEAAEDFLLIVQQEGGAKMVEVVDHAPDGTLEVTRHHPKPKMGVEFMDDDIAQQKDQDHAEE